MAVDKNVLLEQAETAYHSLMLGKSVVELKDSNGEAIRYTPAQAGNLAKYIAELKRDLGLVSNSPLRILL